MAVALWLTRDREVTFPVLVLDGRAIGDSTAVLEERYPDPPLYPADPEQRRRAPELEDFFDDELGPYARLAAFHDPIDELALFAELASQTAPAPLGRVKGLAGAYARAYASLRFRRRQRRGGRGGAGEDRRRAGPARGRAGGERRRLPGRRALRDRRPPSASGRV